MQMNHEDTKAQRYHQDYFVLLRDLVPLWFKKSNPDINKKFSFPYAVGDDDAPGVAL